MSLKEMLTRRKNLSTTVKVKFGDDLVMEFTRMVQEIENRIVKEATLEALKQSGGDPKTQSIATTILMREKYLEYLRMYLVGWEHKPEMGEAFPYSEANAKELFSCMDLEQQSALVKGYNDACDADAEQAEGNAITSAKDSARA